MQREFHIRNKILRREYFIINSCCMVCDVTSSCRIDVIITQPTIYRVIGYFLMSNAYFAVATDSQFELLPRHVLSVRNINNTV